MGDEASDSRRWERNGKGAMTQTTPLSLREALARIMVVPTPSDLWDLQRQLLTLGGENAERVRIVAGRFHACLRELESKIASRTASRWGAVLETASVASVGLQEALAEQDNPLRRILSSSVTALLEIEAAKKNVQAWEVEASLMYYDVAWYLSGELWAVSREGRPELSAEERHSYIDQLISPLLDRGFPDASKCALLIRLFQVVLAGRMLRLLPADGSSD